METPDTSAYARVLALFETSEGQRQFLDWISNPVTQMMLEAGRKLSQPAWPGDGPTGDPSFVLGRSVGGNDILNFFESPRGASAALQDRLSRLVPDYGAREILSRVSKGE